MFRRVFGISAGIVSITEAVPECPNGITCKQIKSSGFVFDCRFGGEGKTAGNVVLLHGFPNWASVFDDTMQALASQGYASIACDQRGYSPGASPANVESYRYNLLRDDVFAFADAASFKTFHLVGHDHGGMLGWVVAGSEAGARRVLSYAALSVPHADAFAKALHGPEADIQQQCASQYFTMFVENDSATKRLGMWCVAFMHGRITNCDQVQNKLYWYNGAVADGYLALPPILSKLTMFNEGGECLKATALRAVWGPGSGEVPRDGVPQKTPVGQIRVPTLLVCGSSDSALLCNRPYAKASAKYSVAGHTYVEVDCGHDLLTCYDESQTRTVINAIVQHVEQAKAREQARELV